MSGFVSYRPDRIPPDDVVARARAFYEHMDGRRSVRMFSADPVPVEAIECAIRTASTAPSGAHRQPWTFVVIGDPDIKRQIREAAEEEERVNYEGGRLPPDWLEALEPLGTDWHKEFLETVPWLVVLFEQRYGVADDGSRVKHFYVKESVGIAAGMFIAAIHDMGLATLPHTPSPMAFLSRLLERPDNERPFAMFPIGWPAPDCEVPDLRRKSLAEIARIPDGGRIVPYPGGTRTRDNSMQTPIGEMWIDDGILWHRVDKEMITGVDAEGVLDAVAEMTGGVPMPAIIDVRSIAYAERKARAMFAGSTERSLETATAIIAQEPAAVAMVDAFMAIDPPQRPTQVFSNPAEAEAWIRSLDE